MTREAEPADIPVRTPRNHPIRLGSEASSSGVAPSLRGLARDGRGRPLLEPPLRVLLEQWVALVPEALGHIDPARILLVAGAARRGARASVRPLSFGGWPPVYVRNGEQKPRIVVKNLVMLYEICFRPLFFLRCTTEERLHILAHELWHLSPRFDGTLDPQRRHAASEGAEADRFSRMVVDAAQDAGLDERIVAFDGELRVPMWLERPPSLIPPGLSCRTRYDDEDLFLGVVRQRGAPLRRKSSGHP